MAQRLPEADMDQLMRQGAERLLPREVTERLRQQGAMAQGARHPQEAMERHLRQAAMVNEWGMLTENNGWEDEKVTHCS